jgi:phosphoribosylanthranilate isomerase
MIGVVLVQIYGFTVPEDLHALAGLAVDHVGIVLDEGYGTWDGVDLPTALALRDAVPAGMRTVALSLHEDPGAVARTVEALAPDVVHLVKAEAIDPSTLATLRTDLAPVEVMSTVPVRDAGAVEIATRLADVSDWLLLDTAHPATGVVGATGHVHDWRLSRLVVEAVDVPVILAGGLGPENVADAIAAVEPAGVDSETRTSRPDDRRRKDLDAVRRFVAAARARG